MEPPVHVVIPTHGRPDLLRRTLDTLAACRLPDNYAETIVVENGSRAGAESTVAEVTEVHPELCLRYVHVERANKSQALNEALATVPEGLAVFFDDDVVIRSEAVAAYAEAARRWGPGHYFAGPFSVEYEDRPPDWLLQAFPQSAKGCDAAEMRDLTYAFGFNWAAYVGDLNGAGGFDPEFGPGSARGATGQETEMQGRLDARGCERVVVPDAWVEHYVSRSRASPRWVVRRRFRLGVSAGQAMALKTKENGIPRAMAAAVRSLVLLPAFFVLRKERKVFAHTLNVSRAAGLVYGYLGSRRKTR